MSGNAGMAISVAAAQQVADTDEFEECVHDPRGWNRSSYIYGQRWNQGPCPAPQPYCTIAHDYPSELANILHSNLGPRHSLVKHGLLTPADTC